MSGRFTEMSRIALLAPVALLAAALSGCGSGSKPDSQVSRVLAVKTERCASGETLALGGGRKAFAGVAAHGAVAYRAPGKGVLARFGPRNVNDYPTVFGVVGAIVRPDCRPRWYRVQLPIRPNGITGYVRAADVELRTVDVRVVVDISDRRLVLYRRGKPVLAATVAVGSPATPTPTGRFYVNQRLVPDDASGPFGPAAIGISAFSPVLTGWVQGGPVAIHGTNEPWSIGHAVSNGCVRLPNATLQKLFRVAVAGTPVIIRA